MNIVCSEQPTRYTLVKKTSQFLGKNKFQLRHTGFYYNGIWIDIDKRNIEIISPKYDKTKQLFLREYIQYLFKHQTIGIFVKGDKTFPIKCIPGVKIIRNSYE